MTEWIKLPPEEQLKANSYYKGHYEASLEFMGVEGPAWEDLTHEQRVNVEQECIRYNREMAEFGEMLRRK